MIKNILKTLRGATPVKPKIFTHHRLFICLLLYMINFFDLRNFVVFNQPINDGHFVVLTESFHSFAQNLLM